MASPDRDQQPPVAATTAPPRPVRPATGADAGGGILSRSSREPTGEATRPRMRSLGPSVGNRAATRVLRQESPSAPDPSIPAIRGLPQVGDTVAMVDDGSGVKAAAAPSDGEAESWVDRIWNPMAATYTGLGYAPGVVITRAFYINAFNRTIDQAVEEGEPDDSARQRRQTVPGKATKKALAMSVEEAARNYITMLVVDPHKPVIEGSKALDTAVKLGINCVAVVGFGKIHNVVVTRFGKGAGMGMDDYTIGSDMIMVRLTIAPTIMWYNGLVDRFADVMGIDPDDPAMPVLRAGATGAGVSTVVAANEFLTTGRKARLAEAAAARAGQGAIGAAEAVGAGGARQWVARAYDAMGRGFSNVTSIRSDVVRGFKLQMSDTARFMANFRAELKKVGLLGALKAGEIPGIWKVGPLTLVLPAAQQLVAGMLVEPPPAKDVLDAEASVLARNLWTNFTDPAITAVAIGGTTLGAPLAAALVMAAGLEDSDKKGDAISLAIDHGRRLTERVERVRDACRHGGLESDPAAVRSAEQLRQGLREGGSSEDLVTDLAQACRTGSGDADRAAASLYHALIDSLTARYYRTHIDDLGTNDLPAYRTFLRIAVGLPADDPVPAD